RESQSDRRILSETVSRSGLERRRRFTRTHGRHTPILKRRRAEREHHLLRYGFHADRGQFIGDAGRIRSGEVNSEGRSRKDEGRKFQLPTPSSSTRRIVSVPPKRFCASRISNPARRLSLS